MRRDQTFSVLLPKARAALPLEHHLHDFQQLRGDFEFALIAGSMKRNQDLVC
jgi:hypothetical protein